MWGTMTGPARFPLWILPLLLLGSCAVTRVPPHAAASRFGSVHAADPAVASEYARILDEVGPVVARAVPGLVIEPVDLRVVDGISDTYHMETQGQFAGATFERGSDRWVELRADLDPGARRGVLAHELVHRWLGPAWTSLPPAFEDGLADVIGDAIRGEDTPRDRMRSFVACWLTLNDTLTLDQNAAPIDPEEARFAITFRADIQRLKPAEIVDTMGRDLVGYHSIDDPRRFAVVAVLSRRVMSHLSVDKLFDLCQDAAAEGLVRVPVQRIFAAAGLDPLDVGMWNGLLLETYGLQEQRAFRQEVDVPWDLAKPGGIEGVVFHLQATVEF